MKHKAFKYRFYPTKEQAELLANTFGCVRYVYNTILKYRCDAYYASKEKVSYYDASKKLTEIKRIPELNFLNDVSCVPLQQCLRNQQKAFSNFFSGKTLYPAFKKKHDSQSAQFAGTSFTFKNGEIRISKSKEKLNIKWSQALPCRPSTITISMDRAGRYFVSCLCEYDHQEKLPTENKIGVDLGLTDLAVLSNGAKASNLRFTKKYQEKLAKYQRSLSRKTLGSKNRNKARIKVAKVHAKIADSRLDNLHKLSSKLINENQVVCIESLKVKNMIKHPTLAKHIADASWGELCRQLTYKADWYGRTLVKIDQWFPSTKRCNCCGYIAPKIALDIRSWICPKCNETHDRDINAAKNILAAGLAVLAFGDKVSDNGLVPESICR